MKNLYILTLFITSLCYSQNTSTDNYYPVGDFENDYSSFFEVSNTRLTASIVTDNINPNNSNSTSSLKLVSNTANGGTAFRPINYQTFGVTGDYRVSFWIKSANVDQKLYVRHVKKNDNNTFTYSKSPLLTFKDTNWHKVQMSKSDMAFDSNVRFELYFVGTTLGEQTFYIDDFKVFRGFSDNDMELSIHDKFYSGSQEADVPAAGVVDNLWASVGYGGGTQVNNFEFTNLLSNSGSKSLKVVTSDQTSEIKRAVIVPKENDNFAARFYTTGNPLVGGNTDNSTTYPEIKYTFSMKIRSNAENSRINVNYKIKDLVVGQNNTTSNFLGLITLVKDTWTTYSGSIVVPRNQNAEKHIPNIQMYDEATYYIDDLSLTWQEWDEATMSMPIKDNTKVAIYPNPAAHFIMINGVDDNTNVEIYDISGKNVKSFMIKSKSEQMDISDLVKGIYLARLNNEQTTLFIKK